MFLRCMDVTRRRFVLLGGGVMLGSVSGCQEVLSSSPSMLDLALYNDTQSQQEVTVELLRPHSEKDVLAFSQTFRVPATQSDQEDVHIEPDITELQPYLIRVKPNATDYDNWSEAIYHYHYYPDENDYNMKPASGPGGPRIDIRFKERTSGTYWVLFFMDHSPPGNER